MTEQSTCTINDYDLLAHQHHWYPEALFGLCYEYVQPGDCLLDIGTGTGLAAEPFARAGLQVFGFDSSPEMLAVCEGKGIAVELKQHDIHEIPWPYADGAFDHIIACGVFHFLPDLDPVFREASRLLRPDGIFAFTTKVPPGEESSPYLTEVIQGTRLYLHQRATLERLMNSFGLSLCKELRLLVRTGRSTDDVFPAFVTQK